MGVLDTLKTATPNRTLVYLVLNGTLQAEYDSYKAQLPDAATKDEAGAGSLADPTPHTRALVEKMETVRERMQASRVGFLLQAMQWEAQLALAATHPPREGNLIDAMRGFNVQTFYPAIIRRSTVSITDADGDTTTGADVPDDTWVHLLGDGEKTDGTLPSGAMAKLSRAAMTVNESTDAVPPSARSLLESQESGTSSTSPSPGESAAPSGSEVGNPRTSPSTSTTRKSTTRKTAATKKAASSKASSTSQAGSDGP